MSSIIDTLEINKIIPKKIFIVPYRNRIQHKFFFIKYMSFILEDSDDYEVYFSHQNDNRTFNRGATKNIGFIAMKNKYPNDYKNITFIFNDVDTIPFHKLFDYETTPGTVKHYYGYDFALGGIVVIKGEDFEKINGFPCYWGWGMEDDVLQKRCLKNGINIDRSNFYKIGSPEILQLFDGISRIISKKNKSSTDYGLDGIKSIKNLNYSIDKHSKNNSDNIYTIDTDKFYYININTFTTYDKYENNSYYVYDLREPTNKILNPDKAKEIKINENITDNKINDWTNISYYPTAKERRENVLKTLIARGDRIPEALLRQISQDRYTDTHMPENKISNEQKNKKNIAINNRRNTFIATENQPVNNQQNYQKYSIKYPPKKIGFGLGGIIKR